MKAAERVPSADTELNPDCRPRLNRLPRPVCSFNREQYEFNYKLK
jgi:hypothetical protein